MAIRLADARWHMLVMAAMLIKFLMFQINYDDVKKTEGKIMKNNNIYKNTKQ